VLAERAVRLGSSDALTETFIAAGYTLSHDLARATIHADRALALDGGCAWAWGRRGWVHAYRGETQEAIECFQTARSLAPADRLDFLWSVGIAAGHFDAAQYDVAARWFERALAENPGAKWINHALAPTYALANQVDKADRSFAEFTAAFPDVRIGHVRSGLPYRLDFLDRIADGLESLGMSC
jgi:tetratricopeptide (TPR) repeat protein